MPAVFAHICMPRNDLLMVRNTCEHNMFATKLELCEEVDINVVKCSVCIPTIITFFSLTKAIYNSRINVDSRVLFITTIHLQTSLQAHKEMELPLVSPSSQSAASDRIANGQTHGYVSISQPASRELLTLMSSIKGQSIHTSVARVPALQGRLGLTTDSRGEP